MTLSLFIRENIDPIVADWVRFARSIASASRFDTTVLRDHAAGILTTIADDIEHRQSALQQEEKSKGLAPENGAESEAHKHGTARLLDGFTVNDAMSEFRALRATVLRHWSEAQRAAHGVDIEEVTRFNEAIDQAIAESMVGFSADKERTERLMNGLLVASPDLSFVVDLSGNLLYGNPALASEFGLPLSAQQGKPFAQLETEAAGEFQRLISLASKSGAPVKGELPLRRGHNQVCYEYLLVPVAEPGGRVEAIAGSARDITARKVAEDRLRHGAHYDNLTGLPNRYLFRDRLEHEIKRADRIDLPLALLYIDLDGFKAINDQFGHDVGDHLLRQCAQRIGACVRDSDTVARLGGDEFTAIITEITHLAHVDLIAQHILDELNRPFMLKDGESTVSGSIGIALYPRDASSSDELTRNADKAMYAAKVDGRNRFRFFTEEMRQAAALRMKTIGELRQALACRQLAVFYQPILELQGGTIVGAEAQLRWQHPLMGLLPAREFFPLAEEAGMAMEIDEWVMGDALTDADDWNRQRAVPLYISINHSTLGVTESQTSRHLKSILDRVQKASSPIALEINEAILSRQSPAAMHTLDQVAKAGIQIYLDGFGKGTTSITSLTTGGLTGLKIDSAVVHGLDQAVPRAIAEGLINIAHGLGLKVVAEGVETAAQRDCLRGMGCDYAQGFLFSCAVPVSRFAQLIRP